MRNCWRQTSVHCAKELRWASGNPPQKADADDATVAPETPNANAILPIVPAWPADRLMERVSRAMPGRNDRMGPARQYRL